MCKENHVPGAIGAFVVSLSQLDIAMKHLLSAVLGLDFNIARALYESQEGTAQRRKMLIAAVETAGLEAEERSSAQKMLSIHSDLFSRRNFYLHNLWTFDVSEGGGFRIHDEKAMKKALTSKRKAPDVGKLSAVIKPDEISGHAEQAITLLQDILNLAMQLNQKRSSSGGSVQN